MSLTLFRISINNLRINKNTFVPGLFQKNWKTSQEFEKKILVFPEIVMRMRNSVRNIRDQFKKSSESVSFIRLSFSGEIVI
jgi:hypothetical protein